MIPFQDYGLRSLPTLVCIPGLFGGPNDFAAMSAAWLDVFHVITLDPDRDKRELGVTSLTNTQVQREVFRSTTDSIHQILTSLGKRSAFLVGTSLGSKIVYDFAIKYPEMFEGGVSLDVGPGPFVGSDLYSFVEGLVQHLDLSIPFEEMKSLLREYIIDRNLRSMIQTQLHYPDGKPPARWKPGIENLSELLSETMKRFGLDEQFERLAEVDAFLARTGRRLKVLRASRISAIREEHLIRMRQCKSLDVIQVDDASHFVHVTHKQLVARTVLSLPRVARLERGGTSPRLQF